MTLFACLDCLNDAEGRTVLRESAVHAAKFLASISTFKRLSIAQQVRMFPEEGFQLTVFKIFWPQLHIFHCIEVITRKGEQDDIEKYRDQLCRSSCEKDE